MVRSETKSRPANITVGHPERHQLGYLLRPSRELYYLAHPQFWSLWPRIACDRPSTVRVRNWSGARDLNPGPHGPEL